MVKVTKEFKCPYCGSKIVAVLEIEILPGELREESIIPGVIKIREPNKPPSIELKKIEHSDYAYYSFNCEVCGKQVKSKDFFVEESEDVKLEAKKGLLKKLNQCSFCGAYVCESCYDSKTGLCIECKRKKDILTKLDI